LRKTNIFWLSGSRHVVVFLWRKFSYQYTHTKQTFDDECLCLFSLLAEHGDRIQFDEEFQHLRRMQVQFQSFANSCEGVKKFWESSKRSQYQCGFSWNYLSCSQKWWMRRSRAFWLICLSLFCRQCCTSEDLNPVTLWFRKGSLETQYRNMPDLEFHYYMAGATLIFICMALLQAITTPGYEILSLFLFLALVLVHFQIKGNFGRETGESKWTYREFLG